MLLCKSYYGLGLSEIISAKNGLILTNTLKSPLCYIFSLILPIITSLIYSDSYIIDKSSGINNMIYTRVNKSRYIRTKGLAVFLISFISVLLPLIIEYIFVLAVFPLQGHFNLGLASYKDLIYTDSNRILIKLATYKPYLNLLLFIVIRAAFGGVFSLFAYGISFVKNANRYIVIISSFIAYLAVSILCNTLSKVIYSKQYSLFFGTNIFGINGYGSIYMILLQFLFFFISSILLIEIGIHKEL